MGHPVTYEVGILNAHRPCPIMLSAHWHWHWHWPLLALSFTRYLAFRCNCKLPEIPICRVILSDYPDIRKLLSALAPLYDHRPTR